MWDDGDERPLTVQSVAPWLLCDREAEIEAFVPRQYWTVHAELAAANGVPFPATLCRLDGMEIGKAVLATPLPGTLNLAINAGPPRHIHVVFRM